MISCSRARAMSLFLSLDIEVLTHHDSFSGLYRGKRAVSNASSTIIKLQGSMKDEHEWRGS